LGTGLVLATPDGITLVSLDPDGKLRTEAVPGGKAGAGTLGPALAADFDGDSLVDVVQAGKEGLLLYRGTGGAGFASPVLACTKDLGGVPASLFAGDFDADGLLDIAAPGIDNPLLFWNEGKGRFREVSEESGELPYIGKPEGRGGNVCDINNDGRQDIFLVYESMEPQVFFNRGFRCFGYARQLEPDGERLSGSDVLYDGQRGGAVMDLDGDGGQDMSCVTAGGEIVVLFRDTSKGRKLGLTVAVKGAAAPLNVTAYDEDRCLGTQAVASGSPVFFGKRDEGPLRLEYQFPGQAKQTKEVILLKPEVLVLTP